MSSTVLKRVAFLNRSGALAKPLRYSEVRGQLDSLGEAGALKILQDLEEQAGDVPDPVTYIREHASAAGGDASGAPQGGQKRKAPEPSDMGGGIVAKRVRLLNSSDLLSKPIVYERVREGLGSIGIGQAMTILKGLEDVAHGVVDPTKYIRAAVKSAGGALVDADEDNDDDEDADVANDEEMAAAEAELDEDEDEAPPRKMVKTEPGLRSKGKGKGKAKGKGKGKIVKSEFWGVKAEDLPDRDRIERRVHWLNMNANLVKSLNFEQVGDALESIGVHQSMRVLRRLEESAETVDDPAAFIHDLVGRSGWIWSKSDVIDEDSRVAKRVHWINQFGGLQQSIRYAEVADILDGLKVQHAMVLLRELEMSSHTISDPTAFIKTHCDKAGLDDVPAPMPEGSEYSAFGQRIEALNASGKLAAPIELQEVSAGLMRVGEEQAGGLLDEVERKGKGVKDPTGFIKFKLKAKLASLGFTLEDEQVADPETKIVKRIEWLNDYGGLVSDIDYGQVSSLLLSVGIEHAMTIMKELEDNKSSALDPTGFIKDAVLSSRKRGSIRALGQVAAGKAGSSGGVYKRSGSTGGAGVGGGDDDVGNLTGMLGLLNKNSMVGKPIRFSEVAGALDSLGPKRGYRVLQEMQEKGLGLADPAQYIRSKAAMFRPVKAEVQDEGEGDDVQKITRRVSWLNQFGGFSKKIQADKIVGALYCLGVPQSMAILKGLQEKGSKVPDPTAYIKAAVQRANGVRVSSVKAEVEPEEEDEDEEEEEVAEEEEAQEEQEDEEFEYTGEGEDDFYAAAAALAQEYADEEEEMDLGPAAPSTPPDAVPATLWSDAPKSKKPVASSQPRVVGAVKGLVKLTSAPTKNRPVVVPKIEFHAQEADPDDDASDVPKAPTRSGLGTTPQEKRAHVNSYAQRHGLQLDPSAIKALARLPFYKSKDIIEETSLGGRNRQGVTNPSRYVTIQCERMSGGLGVEQGIAMELAVSLGVVLNNDALDELASVPRKDAHAIIRDVSRNDEARTDPIDFIQTEVWKCRAQLDARPFPFKK